MLYRDGYFHGRSQGWKPRSPARRGWEGTCGSISRKAESQLPAGDRSRFAEHHLILLRSQNPKPQLGSMETRRLTRFLSNRALASSQRTQSRPWKVGQKPLGEFTWLSRGAPHASRVSPIYPQRKLRVDVRGTCFFAAKKYTETKFPGEEHPASSLKSLGACHGICHSNPFYIGLFSSSPAYSSCHLVLSSRHYCTHDFHCKQNVHEALLNPR